MSIDSWKKLAGPRVLAARMRSHRARPSRALGATGALQTVSGSASDRLAFGPSLMVSWRALLAAVLLSLGLGVGLYEAVGGVHSSATPSARLHSTSRIKTRGSSHEKGLLSLPTGAQGPVSEALGAESPSYLVRPLGGGFAAASPTQHFKLRFDRSGVSVSSGRAHLGLSLSAIGYGSSLTAVGAVAPRVKANRVVYARAGLTESYVNGPLGLEQGFTIAKAPSGHVSGALTLAMAISGNAHPSLRSGAQGLTFSDGGKPVLRYSGLSVTDARGRVLHSWLALSSGAMLLHVDATGARYPLKIDPFIQQGEKLTGAGEKSEAGALSYSVAMSIEGTTATALIGARNDRGGVGAAWVFTRTGTTWTQQGAKLVAKSNEEWGPGEFGESVALSVEGTTTTALIGAPGDSERAGSAWVFTRTGTTWTQQGGKLTAKSGEETGAGEFGFSVALLAKEGTTALIGAPGDSEHVGSAWAFTRSGTTWTQQGAKLVAKSGEEIGQGAFGDSVAMSIEGTTTTALIGAGQDKEGIGAAWVFTRSGTTWTQQGAKLVAKSGEETGSGAFGVSVALAVEGTTTTALIGAPGEGVGAAWAFTRSGTTWTQQGTKLTAKSGEESANGEFGFSVALSLESTTMTALIGAPGDAEHLGAAWVFTRSGTTWTQQGAKLVAKSGEEIGEGSFGYSVALLAKEGTTALMGAPGDNRNVGATWAFTRSGTTWTQQGAKLTAKSGEESGESEAPGKGAFGYSVAMSIEGTTATALIGARNDRGGVGAAWVFTRTGTTWTQQGAKLTAKTPEEVGAGEFGASVALSVEGTTTTALIGAPGDNERVGAAWVFTRSGTTWTQQGAKLVAKSGEEIGAGEFGFSATLLAKEGTTALIGAPGDKEQIGAAWVFTRSGTTWTQQGAKLVAKSGEEIEKGEFGDSVAMSIESTTATALIGARGDKGGIGAAWVFTRSGTTWTQQGAKLVAKSGEETGTGAFGSGVALAVEGTTTTALIGASGDKEGIGAAWVFTRSGTTWTQQGAKLVAKSGEETGNGFFGSSVALSIESTTMTALIGAPHDNTDVGAAWVFTRTGTTWTQQGTKLLAKTPEEFGKGEFGATVALLAKEGTTALFGAPADNHGVGTAWAFARSGTTWTQQSEKLTPKSGEETSEEESSGKGAFGYSVALSSEGNTALIGGPPDLGVGAAWVFTRTGTTWTQQGAKLVAKSGEEVGAGEFGSSVALSADGSTALIGGYRDNADVGAAWVFTRSGTTWTQQGAKLVAKSGEESGEGEFGVSVALSADGNTALIGSSGEPLGFAAHRGAAWVFTRTGTTWAQQGGKLVSAETTGSSEFGFSVALAGSGNIALIGAPGDNTNVGAAWVYTRAGTTWTQQGTKILPKSGEETGEAHFGDTVALSSEGNTALIGGPFNKETTGAAWVFTSSGSTWTQQGEKLTPKSGEEIGAGEFGASLALGANGRAALIGAPQDNGNLGAAWMFTRSGSTWTQQATKILPKSGEEIGEGQFGYAVALSSEANTALIGGADDNNTIGAAWTFANTAPFVETKPATSITQTTATLSAVVNPDGVEVTTCEFEYGTSVAYGKTAKCGSGPGSGTTPVAVSAAITGLSANTTYHYRIIASNSGGSTQGQDETFKTTPNPPTVVTKPASAITPTTATLNGTVNPNGVEITKCEFEYGTSISYTKTAKCTALPGSGESPVAVSAPITGLAANTLYHFRLIAGTATAEGKGSDETFTTSPGAPVVETKPASSITYNSAVLNATVNPEGGEVTTCILEIATAEFYEANGKAYESGEECSSLPGKGTSPVAVSALAGVSAKTTYHFRILACSSTCSEGADLTFESLPNPPTVETKPASSITMTSATLNATVNPNSGTVGKCEFEYGTTVAYGKTAACVPSPGSGGAPVGVSASVTGLTAGTSYHFRIVAENAGGKREGADEAFTTVPNPPTVVTKPASSVTQTSATFTGTVNPNAGTITKCEFEYGTTVSYGKTAPCVPSTFSGSSPVAVSATVTGLTANTTYHYRLVASNAGGKGEGADETVKTLVNPPTVETKPASSITQTSVTLNGSVNPNGGEAKCEFEYGTTVSYGKTIACAPSTMTGSSPVAVSASVTGLTAGTTYHFRAVAISAGGKGEGADAMFQTSPALSAPTAVTGTGSSLTASVASVTGTVNPNNGPVTECEFEYGTTVSYGSAVPCRPTPGSGTSAVAVSAPIGGLAAGTTYHFRVSATNSAGNGVGSDQTFVTPASVHVHWYKSLNRVEEGKKVPFISWGTLSVSSSKGGASTECEVAASGYVENPVGASEGAFEMEGAETTQAFNAYDCTNSECEAEGGTAGLAGEGLPWSGALSEEVKGTFRLPSAGVQLYVHCRMASSPPTEKPGTGSLSAYEERRSSEYNLVGAATCTSNAGGSTKPKVANGSSLEKQTKLQFSGGAGGELECGAAGKLTTTGTVKMQGFTESELMSVKNP